MKAYGGNKSIFTLIFNLSRRRRWEVIFTPWPFYPPPPPGTYRVEGGADNRHLDVFDQRQISCLCQESNPVSAGPYSSHLKLHETVRSFVTRVIFLFVFVFNHYIISYVLRSFPLLISHSTLWNALQIQREVSYRWKEVRVEATWLVMPSTNH
jgi:hypothetical protein